VSQLLTEHSGRLRAEGRLTGDVDVDALFTDARAELLGTGPLGSLLEDAGVSEVIVTRFDSIVVLRDGEEARFEPPFTSEAALQRAVRRLCEQAQNPIGNGERVIERRLTGGSLLTAALAPTSVRGTVVVIRKLREVRSMLDDLVRRGMASASLASFLEQCVAARVNLLVTGPRDLGTFRVVSALCAAAAGAHHIVVQRTSEVVPAEDAALFSVTGDAAEAPRLVDLAALVPGAKLVIELASPELSESLLSAVASGVEGVIGIVYASSLRRALARVPADLMAARPGIAADAAREWVAASFDIVVELGRLADGRARILRVCEITGTGGGGIATQEIFAFMIDHTASGTGVQGTFIPSGTVPRVVAELQARGVTVDTSLFSRPR
jgi:pilus assembly protein CpaF